MFNINVQSIQGVITMSKISDKKTRYALTILKDDKAELEKIAKEQNRSLNNLIETILKDYLKK